MNEKEIIECAKQDVEDSAQPKVKKVNQSPIYKLHMMSIIMLKWALILGALMVLANTVLSFAGKEMITIGAYLATIGGAVAAYTGKEIAKGIIQAKNG